LVDRFRVVSIVIGLAPPPPGSWIPFKIKILSSEMPLMIVMQISMTNDRQYEWIAAALLRARKKDHRIVQSFTSDSIPLILFMFSWSMPLMITTFYSRFSSLFAYLTPMIVPIIEKELVSKMPNMFDQAFSISVVSLPISIVST